jgi:hypothetical protein
MDLFGVALVGVIQHEVSAKGPELITAEKR